MVPTFVNVTVMVSPDVRVRVGPGEVVLSAERPNAYSFAYIVIWVGACASVEEMHNNAIEIVKTSIIISKKNFFSLVHRCFIGDRV